MPGNASRDVSTLAGRLGALIGADRVTLGPEVAINDVATPLEVRPADEQQLGAVLALCDADGLGACIAGGATKLGWGNRPDRFDLLISTRDLRGSCHLDADDLTLSVACGIGVADARARVRAIDRILPLDPGRPSCATVGGVAATGDQGARTPGYGRLRDVVLGVKATLADGTPVSFGGRTMKNVAGYDMTKLFLGSFGTLGVITEVTFRLLPRPDTQALMILSLTSLDQGRGVAAQILDSYLQPLALEVVSPRLAGAAGTALYPATAGLDDSNGLLLLVGFAGHRAAVARSIAEVRDRFDIRTLAVLEEAEVEALFEALSEGAVAVGGDGSSLTIRSAVPISEVWGLAQAAESRARANELPLSYRMGAARGILDLAVSAQPTDTARLTAWVAGLRAEAVARGGQLVVTGGLALLAPDFDAWSDPGPSIRLMKRVKERFDPHGILNPGRFMGGI